MSDLQPSRSIVSRYDEIRSHSIREVVVFHSTVAELAKYEAELPFPLIADPERHLYQRFGVESRPGSLLSGRALRAAIAGQTAALAKHSTMRAFGPIKPTGGPFGLPADFLIAPDGRLAAVKYGEHAYDQWTVDELVEARVLTAVETPAVGSGQEGDALRPGEEDVLPLAC